MRAGDFRRGVPVGVGLAGKTLGIVGLGRLGARVARYANALDMNVIAWSPNLTVRVPLCSASAIRVTLPGNPRFGIRVWLFIYRLTSLRLGFARPAAWWSGCIFR